jgi:hypothetical protein
MASPGCNIREVEQNRCRSRFEQRLSNKTAAIAEDSLHCGPAIEWNAAAAYSEMAHYELRQGPESNLSRVGLSQSGKHSHEMMNVLV